MMPYSSTEVAKLKNYLDSKFKEILASKELQIICTSLEASAINASTSLIEKVLPGSFPELLLENKIVSTGTWSTRNPDSYSRNGIKILLDEKETQAQFEQLERNRTSVESTWGFLHPNAPHKKKELKDEDYKTYKYNVYIIEIPVSGSHELSECIISYQDGFRTLNQNAGAEIRSRFKTPRAGFCQIYLSWPLPEKPIDLSEKQIDSSKEQARQALATLKHSFDKAQQDFASWRDASRQKLIDFINSRHDAERLRLQKIKNEQSGYSDVLNKLMDI